MRKGKNNLRNLFAGAVAGLAMLSLLLSSCLKSNNSADAPPTALVTVIQASPDEPPLDFYLNGDRVNQVPLTYGSGIDYFSAFAGQRTGNFYASGTYSPIVATAQFTLDQNMAYSLFLDSLPAKPGILLLGDTLVKPVSGKAGLRFVDLSPDAPAVDLSIQGGPIITANKSFKGYTSFLPVTGQPNFTLQIVKTGTNTVLATLSNVSLTNGYLYTVMLEGLNNTTNSSDKLNIIMITNAYFN
ncbi:MAG TPA: DUF4397 domain-containing protein [Mucilaginibacter sp.]|jgi:hypothetical protein|nr:DUF4397 domain-containing protein [Mucilaginibacter sp.]